MPMEFKLKGSDLEVYTDVGGAIIKKGNKVIEITVEEWKFLEEVFNK